MTSPFGFGELLAEYESVLSAPAAQQEPDQGKDNRFARASAR
jgi:hypothetical protein